MIFLLILSATNQGEQGLPLERVVGVLGGGQLGRMMGYAAHRLGVRLVVLDPEGAESPAGKVTGVAVKGPLNDLAKVLHRCTHAM